MAASGSYTGKPRPAVVVQSDAFNPTHASVTVCLITSELRDAPLFRIPIPRGSGTGLTRPSQVMVDRVASVPRERIGKVIGHLAPPEILAIDRALCTWLGLGTP